jgi:hypothetical protein
LKSILNSADAAAWKIRWWPVQTSFRDVPCTVEIRNKDGSGDGICRHGRGDVGEKL